MLKTYFIANIRTFLNWRLGKFLRGKTLKHPIVKITQHRHCRVRNNNSWQISFPACVKIMTNVRNYIFLACWAGRLDFIRLSCPIRAFIVTISVSWRIMAGKKHTIPDNGEQPLTSSNQGPPTDSWPRKPEHSRLRLFVVACWDLSPAALAIVKPWPQTISLKTKTKGPRGDTKILWVAPLSKCQHPG